MKDRKKSIDRVLNSINWKKIKSYHAKLGIKWEYEFDKEIVYKVPNIPEIQSELTSILEHMADQGLDYISHGNWVIFWEADTGDIRVIFRLADFSFEDNTENTRESLEDALERAVEREDYEYAAIIRDKINGKKNASNNIK